MSSKRKPRKDLAGKFNLLTPIDIKSVGTEDDPCFGKKHSLTSSACQRCGDSEICQIVFSQTTLIKKRRKAEKSIALKDKEAVAVNLEKRKALVKIIEDSVKKKGKSVLVKQNLVLKAVKTMNLHADYIEKLLVELEIHNLIKIIADGKKLRYLG